MLVLAVTASVLSNAKCFPIANRCISGSMTFITSAAAKSAGDCCEVCFKSVQCSSYSFSEDGQCSLHSAGAPGTSDGNCTFGTITGPRKKPLNFIFGAANHPFRCSYPRQPSGSPMAPLPVVIALSLSDHHLQQQSSRIPCVLNHSGAIPMARIELRRMSPRSSTHLREPAPGFTKPTLCTRSAARVDARC